jgi:hypothetical protein
MSACSALNCARRLKARDKGDCSVPETEPRSCFLWRPPVTPEELSLEPLDGDPAWLRWSIPSLNGRGQTRRGGVRGVSREGV